MPPGTVGLDSRGNWRNFKCTIAGQTTAQTRTLDEAGGGGGRVNEYERIDMLVGNKHSYQQLTYDESGNLIASDLLGDMNCDGVLNASDLAPFKLAVNDPAGYATAYPACSIELGDLNEDALVNAADLTIFSNVIGNVLLTAHRYEYDEENRLTLDMPGAAQRREPLRGSRASPERACQGLLTIEYDALGRRIASTEYAVATDPCTGVPGPVDVQTRHIYSGLNTVAEYISCDSGENWGLAREFLWGDRFPEPLVLIDFTAAGDLDVNDEEVLHYVHDALGSVVGLLDAGDPEATPDPIPPKLVERYDYDPYGKTYIESWDASAGGGSGAWVRTTSSTYGNPFAWTAQRYDASVGLYHFPFRSFSPELGRWMQRDPLGYVQGTNLYGYAACMAVSVTDPLGLLSPAPPSPPGWHPPMLPPDEGDDGDGLMGPPCPPEVDPCGTPGDLGGFPAPPEGSDGDGDSDDGDSGSGDGDSGSGAGGVRGPTVDVLITPIPPTPPPHTSGGGNSGGGKSGEGQGGAQNEGGGIGQTPGGADIGQTDSGDFGGPWSWVLWVTGGPSCSSGAADFWDDRSPVNCTNVSVGSLGVGLGAAGLAGAIAALPYVIAATPALGNIDPNKLHYIFGNAEHKLQGLVQQFGSPQGAFQAIRQATQAAVNSQGIMGKFETAVPSRH